MKVPIPDDWNEESDGYILGLVCIPNSQMWRSLVRGKIQELSRGRVWDEATGIIKDAQTVGWAIYDSFMTCKLDDLVIAVETINSTLAGLNSQAAIEKVVFELNRVNYNLDRIRDNLDSLTPDGAEDTEYGLATIVAAIGPNVTKSTEFIRHIGAGLNTNLVGIIGESDEFAEPGFSPKLDDNFIKTILTGFAVSRLPQNRLNLQLTVDFPYSEGAGIFEFLVEVRSSLGVTLGIEQFRFEGVSPTYGANLALTITEAAGYKIGDSSVTGLVTVMDRYGNEFSDTF